MKFHDDLLLLPWILDIEKNNEEIRIIIDDDSRIGDVVPILWW